MLILTQYFLKNIQKNENHFTSFYNIGYCNDLVGFSQVNEYIFSTLDNITK